MEKDKSQRSIHTIVKPEVIAQYAGTVAMECTGIVGMGALSLRDGVVRVLKNDHLSRGVRVRVSGHKIWIDFHLIIAYGISIQAVSDNLIESVIYHVEKFTGLEVAKVNVFIEGVRAID